MVMAATIDQLRVKVERIEQDVAEVRQELARLSLTAALEPEQWWAARMERVRMENARLRPVIDRVFGEMGIVGEPIGAEQVQKMMATDGVMPEENLFSRGILEMREE
jgi:hypothetical protein